MPFLPGNLPHDKNNVAPRVGANVRLDDKTSVRGGYGLFFAFAPNDVAGTQSNSTLSPIIHPGAPATVCSSAASNMQACGLS